MKLFFDTETTGLFNRNFPLAHQPHIVQLAALLADECGVERAAINLLITPEGWTIPKEAADVHGITTEMATAYGVPIRSAMHIFAKLVKQARIVIAHNIDFDRTLIGYEAERLSVPFPVFAGKEMFCTMQATTDICQLPGKFGKNYKWPKLAEAYRHLFGEELKDAHDAMVDLRACKRVYLHLIGMTGGKP